MKKRQCDFSGYATKNDLRCSDGRTIRHNAFKEDDGAKVPLVYQHVHNDINNVLGHAILENRDDGVYTYGYFNDTAQGMNAKKMMAHGDIEALSIFANKLKQQGSNVMHGSIKEVSLVLSGANPGALIDNVTIEHSDGGMEEDITEAVIYNGLNLAHSDDAEDNIDEEDEEETGTGKTVAEAFEEFTDEQKNVVGAIVAAVIEEAQNGSESEEQEAAHSDVNNEGEESMKNNVFEQDNAAQKEGLTLTHDDFTAILSDAQSCGSFKKAFTEHVEDNLSHATNGAAGGDYGIENIEILFPDAKVENDGTPRFIKRDTEWVAKVLSDTHHTPFSRVKSTAATITADEARAKGYVTGARKVEEVFPVLKRIVTPTTIYKKQKMDRDDIIDITGFDVVAWLKSEMRIMLNEELARAILIGDGRSLESSDKINETNIIPIISDDALYSIPVSIKTAESLTVNEKMVVLTEGIVRERKKYKGTGTPSLYMGPTMICEMLLVKDGEGRRLYRTLEELASALRVSSIVEVAVMDEKDALGTVNADVFAILVNLTDYTVGADKGGEIGMFDDFDIDYNQYKYLLETRCSGALTVPYSALVFSNDVTTA